MTPRNYTLTWVTDQLAVGPAPMSTKHLTVLREAGIDAIINLCGEFCDLHGIETRSGFEVYYMPLADEEAPELIELEQGLAWLDEAIYLGKKVLIHCRHGIGRTGTVLNAYLLRRGLGHRMAWQKLKKLRSKPANFAQWWTIRKYGRTSGKLSIREPSLEMQRVVDLTPFFKDYAALEMRAEDLFTYEMRHDQRCGRDHSRCCATPIRLSLIEAVYLTHFINAHLSSKQRLKVIEKAVETARQERNAADDVGQGEYCLSGAGSVCPLLEENRCLLWEHRPLQCRTFGLPQEIATDLWETVLAPGLEKASLETWFAYTGVMAQEDLSGFALADVVSGRYVQTMFHLMMQHGQIE